MNAVKTYPVTPDDFLVDGKEVTTIDKAYDNGNTVKYVLLSDKRIAFVREGKGKDVEVATMKSNGDQTKYISSLMSSCVEIAGVPAIMEDLAELSMKDYMRVQLAFSELNF